MLLHSNNSRSTIVVVSSSWKLLRTGGLINLFRQPPTRRPASRSMKVRMPYVRPEHVTEQWHFIRTVTFTASLLTRSGDSLILLNKRSRLMKWPTCWQRCPFTYNFWKFVSEQNCTSSTGNLFAASCLFPSPQVSDGKVPNELQDTLVTKAFTRWRKTILK